MGESNGHPTDAEVKLVVANKYIEEQDRKMLVMRQELDQYLKDLVMWKTTTGSEYANRRHLEVLQRMEEIEKL